MTNINILPDNENVYNEHNGSDVLTVNAMPSKTWHWLSVNEARIKWDSNSEEKYADELIVISENNKEEIWIDDITTQNEYNSKKVKIEAKENSEVTIVSNHDIKNNLRAFMDINLSKNAKVKLVQLLSSADKALYNEVKVSCDEKSSFELVQAFMGKKQGDTGYSGKIYSNVIVNLDKDNSEFKYDMGYLGQGDNLLDYNLVVNHFGKNTNCEINVNGALKDKSQKTFRGTIDFKKGSSGSVGAENETVLMLGDDVVNKTVPVILCSEEEVSGTHGASIGELDEETLFYFESRGIDKEKAENIMARASVERLVGLIENANEKEIIEKTLQEVLGDD